MGDLYVARQGFSAASPKGEKVTVYQGDIAEEGHYLLIGRSELFCPLEVKYPAPAKANAKPESSKTSA